uniref:Uncharacterized protein n=1 Tax=Rhizophora mucronata TaxID=61149 RepID=A0A2P2JNN7_RHIMU
MTCHIWASEGRDTQVVLGSVAVSKVLITSFKFLQPMIFIPLNHNLLETGTIHIL